MRVTRKEEKAVRQAKYKAKQLHVVEGTKRAGLKRFSGRQLAWHRLEGLRRLAELRGGYKAGGRLSSFYA